jgi:hypothetical protein
MEMEEEEIPEELQEEEFGVFELGERIHSNELCATYKVIDAEDVIEEKKSVYFMKVASPSPLTSQHTENSKTQH